MPTPQAHATAEIPPTNPVPAEPLGAVSTGGTKAYLYLEPDTDEAKDFVCDAEAAMAYLGIKRSRLTQISGRELPCARIKVDRYIRPMYRWEDVKSYHQSAKTAVSYAKSKQLMEITTHSLQDRLGAFATTLHELSVQLTRCERDLATQSKRMQQLTTQLHNGPKSLSPSPAATQSYPSCLGKPTSRAGAWTYHQRSPAPHRRHGSSPF